MAELPMAEPRTDDAEIERRLATAELVLEIATAAAGELDLDEILRIALSRLAGVVRFTGGSIALVEGDELVIRAAIGLFEHEAVGQRQPRGRGRSWHIVESLVPERIDDLMAAGIRITGQMAPQAVRSWLGVPIPRGGVGIGLLEIDSTARAAFTDGDAELVATVARALAGPIDLAARYDAERRAREIRDAFGGMISHELRTPITTIYGMMQVLRRSHGRMPEDQRAQLIEDVESEADRLRRLVEDLLVLGRAESGRLEVEREPLALGHLLRRAMEDESRRWPRHRFSAAIPSYLPIVLGEAVAVEQVVRNLLTNAAKYSPADSPILLSVAEVDGGVKVTVADEGIGLPDGDPSLLFDLYYRSPEARRQAAGAGIGLFVCRQLLAAMGGSITARRRDPAGSEFAFTLPVAAES
jgi:two-component system sensor histidine kinase KdpD